VTAKEMVSKGGTIVSNSPFFPKLFEPGRIAEMELKNRIILAPMGTNLATLDGSVTQPMKDYYEVRAKDGVGLIMVEGGCIDSKTGKSVARQFCADDDRYLTGLSELAEVIHKHGAKAVFQLFHAGKGARSAIIGGQPVAPSAIPWPYMHWAGYAGEMPRELTVIEIKELVDKFASAAERAKRAGFDGVDVHAHGMYLIQEFLSPASNKRKDEYGGELKNRARFLLEIIKAIKEATGQSYPVVVRLTFAEFGIEDAFTLDECVQVARMAQEAGADAVRGAVMTYGISPWSPMEEPPNSLAFFTDEIKKMVTIPVIAGQRISPEIGERMLQEKRADFVAIGRGFITDPELVQKAASGRTDEIVPCIGCIRCIDTVLRESEVECMVNPAMGKEREYELRPAARRKKVIVVGGGPAGMEAARVATLRGHRVTLYEKQSKLGGQLLLAILPPHKNNLVSLIDYLTTQMVKRGVKVNLGIEVTPELIEEAKPDVVILATGVIPFTPEIPGIHRANVVTAQQALEGQPIGKRVIVIGGELVGCETAEFLAEKGKKVTMTRRGPEMATRIGPGVRALNLSRLTASGVTMLTGVKYEQVTDRGLAITTKEEERQIIEADTIVLAAGAKPNRRLSQALEGKVPEVYDIGDCTEPRGIAQAIADGYRIGRRI